MIEPLFGSSSPTWPSIPTPGVGWPQLTGTLGTRAMSGASFGSPQLPPMTVTGPVTGPQPSLPQTYLVNSNAGFSVVPSPFGIVGSAWPAFVAPDIAATSTIRALLEAVAMRRGQPLGPTNDQECEDFVYDALELVPAASEVDVRCEGARVTLTGSVQQKRLKHDVGEIAWAIPGVNDVQNNITIVTRRRARSGAREEPPAPQSSRKPA